MSRAQSSLQIGIVIVAVGLGAWKFTGAGRVPVAEQQVEVPVARQPAAQPLKVAAAPLKPVVAKEIPKPRALPTVMKFEFDNELDQYSVVKQKVFLSESDRVTKHKLVSNFRFIQGLGDYLRQPLASRNDSITRQGAAIDMLFDALASEEGRSAAEAALRDVVLDQQIESDTMDAAARQSLAGVKGEVLYKWAAVEPQRTSELEGWLPGPVSRKIWANVQDAQDRNVKESIVIGQHDQ